MYKYKNCSSRVLRRTFLWDHNLEFSVSSSSTLSNLGGGPVMEGFLYAPGLIPMAVVAADGLAGAADDMTGARGGSCGGGGEEIASAEVEGMLIAFTTIWLSAELWGGDLVNYALSQNQVPPGTNCCRFHHRIDSRFYALYRTNDMLLCLRMIASTPGLSEGGTLRMFGPSVVELGRRRGLTTKHQSD